MASKPMHLLSVSADAISTKVRSARYEEQKHYTLDKCKAIQVIQGVSRIRQSLLGINWRIDTFGLQSTKNVVKVQRKNHYTKETKKMDIGSIISGAADALGKLFNTGYGVYQDQRDYALTEEQWAYKQAMDRIQMMREDNAVQRRAMDLQAAGINRNLASGSAASSGVSAVAPSAHSGRVDMNLGQVYDAYLANVARIQEIKNRKLQNEYQRTVNAMVKNEQSAQWAENNVRKAVAAWQLGYEPHFDVDGYVRFDAPDGRGTNIANMLSADLERQQMYADMARKENALYYFNQFADRAVDVSNIVFGAKKAFAPEVHTSKSESVRTNYNYNYRFNPWKY